MCQLLRLGHTVLAVARSSERARVTIESQWSSSSDQPPNGNESQATTAADVNSAKDDEVLARVTYLECDIGTAPPSREHLIDAHAVIWAAQSTAKRPLLAHPGPQGPRAIEYEALGRLAEACTQAGVRRFVVISSLSADRRWSWINLLLNALLGQVVYWKYQGERRVATLCAREGIEMKYTILRMGGLVNEPSSGPAAIQIAGRVTGRRISRNDAAAIAAAVAVLQSDDRNATFDCACLPEGEESGHESWDESIAAAVPLEATEPGALPLLTLG